MRAYPQPQKGVTLVELIISIVIISIGLTGILIVINRNSSTNADPMVQHQVVSIAEAYLEEALTKNFSDPDGTNVGETRATFDNVLDYNGLSNTGARDQNDLAIAGLGLYNVSMQVVATALNGVAAGSAWLVTVTVTGPNGVSFTLNGYQTNHP